MSVLPKKPKVYHDQDHTSLWKVAAYGVLDAVFSSARLVTAFPGILVLHRGAKAHPIPSMRKRYDFRYIYAPNQRKVYLIRPKRGISSRLTVLYLHGGAYVTEFFAEHWHFMGRLADELGCTVIAPDYPVLPKGDYRAVFDMVEPLYQRIIRVIPPEQVVVMGDSAGGGMTLALCQKLAQNGSPQPGRAVLLSPWLDVSMTNPEIATVEPYDHLLWPDLKKFGELYAADGPLENPLVSPLYGPLEGLGEITLFTGTYDILNPDARKWTTMANEAGVVVDYREYEGMPHVWMLLHEDSAVSKYKLGKYGRESAQRSEQAMKEILELLRYQANKKLNT